MFKSRWAPVLMVIAVTALLGFEVTARSQMPGQQPSQYPGQPRPMDGVRNSDSEPETSIERQEQSKLAEKRNEERQAQLVQETARLFDLAKELKEQVGKTNKDVLSIDVVKKADEIEKLAKSVRDKMKAD